MENKNNINSFRDLKVWQMGMSVAKETYFITKKLPKEEMFGLISQMRRASVSIPSNIAEGRQRSTRKDFCQFLHIAMGSLAELETQLLLADSLYQNIEIEKIIGMVHEERRMVSGMISKLKS
jgi:four helix bundle protein